MAVVLFHYAFRGYAADGLSSMNYALLAPVARYGYLGVDLFFMISGFVILAAATNAGIKGFVVSRCVRLYPAFWACCTITFLMTLLFGRGRFSASGMQYIVNMITLGGEVYGFKPIDGAYWSLQVELRFYALVAIALLAGKMHRAQMLLWIWLVATIFTNIAVLITLNSFLLVTFIKLYDFLVAGYSSFFIAGAAFCLVRQYGLSLNRAALLVAAWGLAVLTSIAPLPTMNDHYGVEVSRSIVALSITAFFGILLLVSLRCTGWWGRRDWFWLGSLTYPLYLVHQNVGFMIFNMAYPAMNQHVLFWGTVFLTLGLAWGVQVGIEERYAPVLKRSFMRVLDLKGGRAVRKEAINGE